MKISYSSLYSFKENHCRLCSSNEYFFNETQTFIDMFHGEMFNSDKVSWKSLYLFDDDEKMYVSGNLWGMI